jgi:hypothetical protein
VGNVSFCLLLTGTVVFAQARPPANVRELVRESVRHGEAGWRNSMDYSCVKRDVTKQFDSNGNLRTTDADAYQMVPLGGHTSYELPVEHNHEPISPEKKLKAENELRKLRAGTPAQKEERFEKLRAERSYMAEVPDAFDFKITGEASLPTGPAWVIEAAPRPDYQPKSRYAHMFPAMRGTLWIDEADVQWVKADAEAIKTVTFGVFIARLAKGSHIVIEQMKLPDGSWVAKRIEAKASARTLLFFNHNFEEDITYSGYRKEAPLAAAK